MNSPRALIFIALSIFAATAQASFDMMLAPSISGKINRYDPVNNVSLGSYGPNGTRVVTYDPVTKDSITYDGSIFRRYRTFTNDLLETSSGASGFTHIEYQSSTNRVFGVSGTGLFSRVISSPLTFTLLSAGADTMRSFATDSTTAYTLSVNAAGTSLNVGRYNIVTNTAGSTSSFALSISTTARFGKAAIYNIFGSTDRRLVCAYINGSGTLQLLSFTISNLGAVGLLSNQTLTQFSSTNVIPSATAGHEGFFLTGQDSVTSSLTRIETFDNGSLPTRVDANTFTGGAFSAGIYQTANIVAPEPGTMLVLSAGIGLLAKKRKR